MKIVIDIPEEIYKCCLPYKDCPIYSNDCNYFPEITYSIANGTPLPKGHGDLISRKVVLKEGAYYSNRPTHTFLKVVKELPAYSAEQTYDWCNGCKEYDNEKHCCHRYSSFIQESLQENINAVLDGIKAEIRDGANACIDIINKTDKHVYPQIYSRDEMVGRKITYEHCLEIIDKHISRKE